MDKRKIEFLRQVIRLLPMTGHNITYYATTMRYAPTALYNFKNGLEPSEVQYNHIINFLKTNYKKEFAMIMAVLNITDADIYNLEDNIDRYLKKWVRRTL